MEKKQLKDYLHFYIGQEAEGFWTEEDGSCRQSEGIGKIVKVALEETRPPLPVVLYLQVGKYSQNKVHRYFGFDQVAPLLRPLSDVSLDEAKAVAKIACGGLHSEHNLSGFGYPSDKWLTGVHNSVLCLEIEQFIKNRWYKAYVIQFDAEDNSVMLCNWQDDGRKLVDGFCDGQHEITRYLLSRGFDLYGLITTGLALDKTKHPKQ